MKASAARVMSLAAALDWRLGRRLVVTNGCFDVLHAGHVLSLEQARAEGGALLVMLNSDASVRALKGPARPVFRQEHRAYMLAALRCVDAVVVFEGTDCAAEIGALAPEVYAKSDEYRGRQHPGERAALEQCGARVVWVPRVAGLSTSAVVDSLRMGGDNSRGVSA